MSLTNDVWVVHVSQDGSFCLGVLHLVLLDDVVLLQHLCVCVCVCVCVGVCVCVCVCVSV
jgi:hypothetical protein